MATPHAGYQSTHAFYESGAEAYEASTRYADLRILQSELLRRVPLNARILDLGCGAGRDVRNLVASGYRAVGVDYAMTALHLAQKTLDGPFILGDINRLPFAQKVFSAAWAVASLLHIRKSEIVNALYGIAEVVASNGLLFASTKLGTGECVDRDGRLFAYYQEGEWLTMLREAMWCPVFAEVTQEARTDAEVNWLLTVSCRT